jgi:hypothetical protein
MIARILVTGVMLALAAGAFFGATQLPSGPLSPFGILFLTIAGVIWFAWQEICAGFSYGPGSSGDSTELPLAAGFGPMFIKGITNARRTAQPPRRSSADFQIPEPLTPALSPQAGRGRKDSLSLR